jgi:5'-3' exonuclease
MRPTVHLIDASPYIFRAFFALRQPIAAPDGRDVSAVYGFAGFLVRFLREETPTHLAVAFDRSLTTSFRNDFFPAYKANRPLPPDDLVAQLDDCERVAAALGATVLGDTRYEADDFLATLAARVRAEADTVVVSNDKDLAQLVGSGVTWFDFARGVRYDAAAVEEKFGVPPARIPDLLGLAGDAVDNIPGVRGVGAKTAVALVQALGPIEAIYADLDAVAKLPIRGAASVRERLARHRDDALLSKRLATAATDAPTDVGLNDLRLAGADPALVDPLFERLGFAGIRARIPNLQG